VARHTANVVLLRRYEMSTLINRERREPFASVTVRRNRRVCEGRVASDKSRGKCTSASSKNEADEFPDGIPRRLVQDRHPSDRVSPRRGSKMKVTEKGR